MKADNRILWVDYAKAISCFCVMLYHAQFDAPWGGVFYLLCLPAFFFCAGICHSPADNFLTFARRRGKRLLVPYLAFGMLTYAIWLVIGRRVGADAMLDIAWNQPLIGLLNGRSAELPQCPPLWFLPCLFALECIYFGIDHLAGGRNKVAAILVMALLGAVLARLGWSIPFTLCTSLMLLPVYALGAYSREKLLVGPLADTKLVLLILIISSAVALGCYWQNPDCHLSTSDFGNPLLFIIREIAVATLICSISMLLSKLDYKLRLLQLFGESTMIVLLLHLLCFSAVKAASVYLLRMPLSVYDTVLGKILLVASAVVLLLILILCYRKLCSLRIS